MADTIAITPATAADAPALKALLESAYRGDSARQGWNHEADILDDERIGLDELETLLADPAVTILAARDAGALIGCVAVTRKDARLGYLGMLCVAPTLQSGGLGRTLLDAAEDHGRAIGLARMEMTVIDSRESLIAWYVRRGYALTGETRPFHELRPADADAGPQITFVVLEKRLNEA
ncbi:GNAT family N-acetyltransferase [Erythrobacter sp. WG]|uniref:GNAT family N-acetyltransferase n=1 Tax=Erythrobacter sp. WG TaxID=2985510 RepID=UPI00226DF0DB|nr:GNAT family N-acetyltransferase [Erythrobacter sp. WG]MCX9146777.1 GNAT family N-acetyltransferase [Erythrobacter sp. WG]